MGIESAVIGSAIWRRNGRAARFEVFRFTMSDSVKPVIIQLTAEIIQGTK